MGSDVVILVGALLELMIQALHRHVQVRDLIELLPGRPIGPLDVSVELGATGRVDVERKADLAAGLLELGFELRAPVDLEGPETERELFSQIMEEVGAGR